MKRTALKRKTGLKRGSGIKRGAGLKQTRRRKVDQVKRDLFREAAQAQKCCQVSNSGGPWDPHHVIEKQEIRKRGGDIWDTRNALRISERVHSQHTLAVKRIPIKKLRDENIEFAFELMGLAAYVYLRRMYDGFDERVELAVAEYGAPDACG